MSTLTKKRTRRLNNKRTGRDSIQPSNHQNSRQDSYSPRRLKQDSYERLMSLVTRRTGLSWNTLENLRTDADNNAIFSQRVLETVESQVVTQDTPDNWAFRRIFTRADLPFGYKKDTVLYSQVAGKPKFTTGTVEDVNFVSYSLDEESQNVGIYELAYRYLDQELEAIAAAQQSALFATSFDVAREKLEGTLELMDGFDHLTACFGDVPQRLNGFLNHPDVPELDEVGNFDPYTQTEAKPLYDWMIGVVRQTVRDATNQIAKPNYIGVAENLMVKLDTTFYDGTSDTVMDKLEQSMARMGIEVIEPLNELRFNELEQYGAETAGSDRDRILIGENNSKTVDRRISVTKFSRWVMDINGMTRKVKRACRSVRFKKPKKFAYIRHAKKA